MSKLFNNQRKITGFLLRACLPAVASSGLRNSHILKEFRRSNSGSASQWRQSGLVAEGRYYVWSLISNQGDSLMKLHDIEHREHPEIKCNGDFDDNSNVVDIDDASLNANTAMISLQLDYDGDRFYLSVEDDNEDGKYNIVMKPASERALENSDRFIPYEYQGFSIFESYVRGAGYLGCKKDGSLDLIDLYHLLQPDPRALFLIHAKKPPI